VAFQSAPACLRFLILKHAGVGLRNKNYSYLRPFPSFTDNRREANR
jgi:hypothetical protein